MGAVIITIIIITKRFGYSLADSLERFSTVFRAVSNSEGQGVVLGWLIHSRKIYSLLNLAVIVLYRRWFCKTSYVHSSQFLRFLHKKIQ